MVDSGVVVGIDIGSSRTKVAVMNRSRELIGYAVERSGVDFAGAATAGMDVALAMAQRRNQDVLRIISTGYGRNNVPFTNDTLTEISCHGKGCFHYFPVPCTIIDIGGQDNKVIKLDGQGRRVSFKMNRKCAAGTGAFLEEMSLRLAIPLEKMNQMAYLSENMSELGSFCTVFSATEVMEKIRHGIKVPDILKGIYMSVIKRVVEMDTLTDQVILSGGVVAHNDIIIPMMEALIGRTVKAAAQPQLCGAIGAALHALDSVVPSPGSD